MSKRRNDILLAICLSAVALIVLLVCILTRNEGSTVEVTLDGGYYGEYPLDTDAEIIIGKDLATLVIKDGSAHIEDATCPDKLCQKQGKISKGGESVVCLPNKIIVTVNSESGDSVDFSQ